MKIAVVGPGLIGRSIALAARRTHPLADIVEVDRGDALDAIDGASFIVLATPVGVIIDSLRYFAEAFPDATVLDTGSTKHAIVTAAGDARLANFIGTHPMAGAAITGSSVARADLFDSKTWFLVRGHASDATCAAARAFIHRLGALPVMFDDHGEEHDRVMAAVSHLPQVVATTLMAVVGDAAGDDGLRWAGSGLRDTTRLAASSASLWESILASNQSQLRPLLVAMADALAAIADRLDDAQTVQRLFEVANHYRKRLE